MLFRILHMGFSNAWGRFNNITGTVDLDEQDPAKKPDRHHDRHRQRGHRRGEARPSICAVPIFSTPPISRNQLQEPVGPRRRPGQLRSRRSADAARSLATADRHAHKDSDRAKAPVDDFRLGVETSFQIKRADFDMKNMLEGVGNDVLLIVSLEAAHK